MAGSAAYSASATTVVAMAKGNGNSKGVRGGGSAGTNKVTRPPRITSNVKQNLRILKFWKEFERRQTSGPQPATRYRKKKVIKEVLPDDTDFYEDPSSTLHLSGQMRVWKLLHQLFSWMATMYVVTGESLRRIS